MTSLQRGFTLVEVVVVLPIMIVATSAMIAYIINILVTLNAQASALELQNSAQLAALTIKDDTYGMLYFEGKQSSGLTDANKAGGWSAVTDNALIVSEVSRTAPHQQDNGKVVYRNNAPLPCTGSGTGSVEGVNEYAVNNLIYFVSSGTLYERVLTPNPSTTCGVSFRKTTCPAAVATATCPADRVIATNVKSIATSYFTYYGGADSTVPIDTASLGADYRTFVKVTRAELSLTLQRLSNGDPVTTTTVIGLSRTN